MKKTKVLVMTGRVCCVLALATGALSWADVEVAKIPHGLIGLVLVVTVWGLAALARPHAVRLALAAALWVAILPLLGLASEYLPLGEAAKLMLRAFHVVAGLGAIGFAEVLAKRIRATAHEE